MPHPMKCSTLPNEIVRAVIASHRTQLVVAGTAAVSAALMVETLLHGGRWVQPGLLLWLIASTVLATVSARAVLVPGEPIARALRTHAPRTVVQQASLAVPMAIGGLLVPVGTMLHPLLALLAVPIAFIVVALLLAPALLVVGAGAAGSRDWLPSAVIVRLRPHPWKAAGIALVAAMAMGALALPGALGGLLLAATLGNLPLIGPIGVIGYGAAAAVCTPIFGASSALVWRQLSGAVGTHLPDSARDATVDAAAGWSESLCWAATFDGDHRWGTWLHMQQAGSVAVVVEGMAATQLQLLMFGPDRSWIDLGPAAVANQPLRALPLAVGASWLQLQPLPGCAAPTEPIVVRLLVPGATGHAAA
ncbi:MAG: hypothetical protein JWN41_621 [Thermoleophilia bacterium]|nr:hypothetical protein [Thermoleophilia bacterium]